MNLGLDNIRELLERFLSNTGGRRGRDRERARQEAGPAQAGAAGVEAAGVAAPGAEGVDGAAGGGASAEPTQPSFEREERPDPEDLDDDEVVDDLYYRIESLEDELENNGAQLGSIQDSQQHVSEKIEDVDDTIRQLLGVYDRLTDDVNPFTGDGETENGFGIFGENDEGEGFGLETDDAAETVSFADLKGAIEDAAEDADAADGDTVEFDEDDTHVEVQATERIETEDDADEDDGDVTLHRLSGTYASDVIVFEWLTELVATAGPAATLRAISYYDEIGWIDPEVRTHLESVLSGPDLDIHVDPTTTPEELTAEDHAESYTYIMKLNEIHATRQEVES
ncbi:FlaD/FlaE family flagellar protein [Natronobiforma cellulositropha]|uniref:FlaD/FlaE family flagellar protein n=1 Tax=Natronobiforma cellulositropha TaxID=1679076 RepID=UPI0021D610B0|nr:FlaD/FlaE family flagellar protein [Natronobiforma cellulositropha]